MMTARTSVLSTDNHQEYLDRAVTQGLFRQILRLPATTQCLVQRSIVL
jgi:hypothetical protein